MEKFYKGETVVVKSNVYGLKAGERARIIKSSEIPHGTEYCVYPSDGIPTWLPESQLKRETEPTKKEPEYNKVLVHGKHSYTDEEIARAKKLVLDMINSIYADSNEVVFFGKKDKTVYYAILITNGAKCYLEATHDSAVAHVGTSAIGRSQCSDHDEPNEWIGKCVALSKALNKPIPDFIK